MALFLPRRWRRQPQYPVAVYKAHPLGSAMLYASLFSIGKTFNAASTYVAENISSPTLVSVDQGTAIAFDGSSSGLRVNGIPNQDAFTWIGRVYLGSVISDPSLYAPIAARHTTSGGASDWYLYRGYFGAASTTALRIDIPWVAADVVVGNSYAANQWIDAAITRSGSTGSWTYTTYVNGRVDGSATTASNHNTSGHPLTISTFGVSGANRQYENNKYVYSYYANRAFSLAEIAALSENPWQIFAPQRNVLYFLGTAGVNQSVDVPLATIVVAGHAPTANRTQSAIVPAAAITVNAHAPTINQTRAVSVPVANIVVAAHAPTVNRTQSVAVPAANIVVNAYAPTIGQGQSIAVPVANITVAAHAPTINRTQSVSVPVAEIIVNGYAPTVVNSGILPAAALAELYGGNIFSGKKKKKKKEDKPKLEEMVFAVAKTPDGKKAIIGALPKSIQDELPDPQLALVSDLVRKIEDASAKVQKEVERIYRKRRDDEDEDDVFILLM